MCDRVEEIGEGEEKGGTGWRGCGASRSHYLAFGPPLYECGHMHVRNMLVHVLVFIHDTRMEWGEKETCM